MSMEIALLKNRRAKVCVILFMLVSLWFGGALLPAWGPPMRPNYGGLRLVADKDYYTFMDRIIIKMYVINDGDMPLQIAPCPSRTSLIVFNQLGVQIYGHGCFLLLPANLTPITIQPGSEYLLPVEEEWRAALIDIGGQRILPPPAGTYWISISVEIPTKPYIKNGTWYYGDCLIFDGVIGIYVRGV